MRDIQFIDNETAFNYRICGVVVKNNKILLNRLKMMIFGLFSVERQRLEKAQKNLLSENFLKKPEPIFQ